MYYSFIVLGFCGTWTLFSASIESTCAFLSASASVSLSESNFSKFQHPHLLVFNSCHRINDLSFPLNVFLFFLVYTCEHEHRFIRFLQTPQHHLNQQHFLGLSILCHQDVYSTLCHLSGNFPSLVSDFFVMFIEFF